MSREKGMCVKHTLLPSVNHLFVASELIGGDEDLGAALVGNEDIVKFRVLHPHVDSIERRNALVVRIIDINQDSVDAHSLEGNVHLVRDRS